MSINCNPIFDNKYSRKDVTIEFSDDLSTAKIIQGDNVVEVDGAFFRDCTAVMDRAAEEGSDVMLFNTIGTTLSCPTAGWD